MATNEKDQVHISDIGTIFRHTLRDGNVIVDVSSATVTKQIIFTKPGGAKLTKTAVFTTDGTDGKIQYVSVAGDLDIKGIWQTHAYVVLTDGEWRSDIKKFNVFPNL